MYCNPEKYGSPLSVMVCPLAWTKMAISVRYVDGMLGTRSIDEFVLDGVAVLKNFFEPASLSAEVDVALALGCQVSPGLNTGSAGNAFQYVPMMCERTPVSFALIDALAAPAAQLLGRPVIPIRAKGTRYFGGTAWHRDLDMDLASVGFACYLEPLEASSGALRILKGSHRDEPAIPPSGMPDDTGENRGEAVETFPGDVLAFDEHLWHSSIGGRSRRQWRVDFVADPGGPDEETLVREYLAGIFQVGWDGGYDVNHYPSYGAFLEQSGRPWVDRLRDLGAIELSAREEDHVRCHRLANQRS